MNLLAVKIWIAGRRALHTSTSEELATIVPKRPFPDPVKRRSRRPPAGEDTRAVEVDPVDLGVEVFVACLALAEAPAAGAVETGFEAVDELADPVLMEAAAGVLACVAVVDEPPPQSASATAARSPRVATALRPAKRLFRDRLIEHRPSDELIGSTGSWRALDRGEAAP